MAQFPDTFDLKTDNLEFRARILGSEGSELVILLHGFPETSASWLNVMPLIASANYRVVAYDQRGYSPKARFADPQSYNPLEMLNDVSLVAKALGHGKYHLVGHDWGGNLAWWCAIERPNELLSLSVVSTPHPLAFISALANPESSQRERSSYMDFFRQEKVAEEALLSNNSQGLKSLFVASGLDISDPKIPPLVQDFISTLNEPGAMTGALNWYRAQLSPPQLARLSQVKVRTLYVWSTKDVALSENAARLTEQYVDAPYTFVILNDVSHWIPEEAPDQLGQLIVSHLNGN